MTYILDTNACIALINGRPGAVRDRLASALTGPDDAVTSTVVLFELWYGVAKSSRPETNADRLSTFLAGPLSRVDFDADDAREAGEIRAQLESVGRPIGAYDLLVAGQARRRGMTLVTANGAEFGRVPRLVWEDWAGQAGV